MNEPGFVHVDDLPDERRPGEERLGIVSYTNVAPLRWGLSPDQGKVPDLTFVHGVPSELNAALLTGTIDLTLISSVEFLRHSNELVALPDFSIATIGPAHSVALFHKRAWRDLQGASIAVTTDSATSIALLRTLLKEDGLTANFVSLSPDLDAMLAVHDAALVIGDVALRECLLRREIHGSTPYMTDLGQAWFERTQLPFTYAVWAFKQEQPPSGALVNALRYARRRGLADLAAVAADAAPHAGITVDAMQTYLEHFRYFLDTADREGLQTFGARVVPTFDLQQVRYADL